MGNNLTRLQEFNHNDWREIPEMLVKLLTLLFAIVALKNTDGGEDFFRANHSAIMAFVLAVVVYFLASMLLTMLQLQLTNFLSIIITLLLGSLASVLAVAIISLTMAFITLALCLSVFTLVAYFKKREVCDLVSSIKNWIGMGENLPV